MPTRSVGARRLPDGPITAARSPAASNESFRGSNLSVFLPLLTTTADASPNSFATSFGPYFSLLALTVSRTVAPAPSRKASARLQLVQPLRW